MLLGSPVTACTASTKAASTTEASESAKAAPAPTSAPSAATAPTATRPTPPASTTKCERKKQAAPPASATPSAAAQERDHNEEEHQPQKGRDLQAARRADGSLRTARRERWRRSAERGVELKIEFGRESLGDLQRHQLDRAAVIPLLQKRNRVVLDLAGRRVGDESFRAKASLDAHVTAVGARLLWHDEDQDTAISCWVARLSCAANLPRAADLPRNISLVTALQIGKGNDGDVATGLRANVLDDPLDARRVVCRDDIREVVHEPDGRRDLQRSDLDLQCGHKRGERDPEARHEYDRR